ncbi:MAG: gliding motility-associated protein GldE [Bacteroidales bacterium]
MPLTTGALMGMISVAVLLFVSAMISGSEVAFFSLPPQSFQDIKQDPVKQDALVLKHLEKPERLLANILITNNFVNVGVVVIMSFVTSDLLDFSRNPGLGFLIQVVFITFLLLLFGEIIPKVYANRFALSFARRMAGPLAVLDRLFQPLIFILLRFTRLVNRRLARKGQNISMDDLSEALDLTTGVVKDEKQMLEGIVRFSNLEVSEIMVPRTDVTAVDMRLPIAEELIGVIIESGYSRIPVYEETFDRLQGHSLCQGPAAPHQQTGRIPLAGADPGTLFVPETKKINDLLDEFREKKIHMAIAVDEYGGTEGIVTMEDILEEVVGEIRDESDEAEEWYRQIDAQTFIFDAKTLLNDFYKVTGREDFLFDDVKGEAETLADSSWAPGRVSQGQ